MRVVFIPALLFMLIACDDDKSKPPEPVITFEKAIGTSESEYASEVHQTSDGGYIIVGTQGPILKIYVVKTDKYGNVEWEKTLNGGPNHASLGTSISESENGFIVVATTNVIGVLNQDILVTEIDRTGKVIDSTTYNFSEIDGARRVRIIQGQGSIVLGHSNVNSVSHLLVMRLSETLDTMWTKTLIKGISHSMAQLTDGGFLFLGKDIAPSLIRTDISATPLLIKEYDWLGSALDATVLTDGFVMVGSINPTGTDFQVAVVKVNFQGDSVWTHIFGGPEDDWATSVCLTPDEEIAIAGCTYSFGEQGDVLLLKLTSDGQVKWYRTYGGASMDCPESIRTATDGGFIISGSTFSTGQEDIYLIKTDSLGLVYP